MFEKDLEQLVEHLGRPYPEFFGVPLNHQSGGQNQWVVTTDLRGKLGSPIWETTWFSVKGKDWKEVITKAMQEALARLCGQNVNKIQSARFFYYPRHDSMGKPMDVPPHPELKHHAAHLDLILHETRKDLDNSRAHVNQMYLDHAKKDYIIDRLSMRIASLEQTVEDLEKEDEEPTIPEEE